MHDSYLPLPDLVKRADELARVNGFTNSCTSRTGALLSTLAASVQGSIAEFGTGYGVGSAWLLSGMRPGSRLVSVERVADQQRAVTELFSGNDAVSLILGEWREALAYGPFGLAFVDVGEAKDAGADEVIAAVSPGGIIVLDDFTPGPRYRGEHDERWHRWMRHPRLVSCELLTGEGEAVIVATRIE